MQETTLDLAYSPCPNDTYIFAAWTQALLPDSPPVRVVLDDVEALNLAARSGEHALTKVSYGAIPYLLKDYRILRAGGALGRGCGPLVIARPGTAGDPPELARLPEGARIAIPGELTTAYLLLRLAMRRAFTIEVMRFDRIVDAVAAGTVDAGLIIHESRFTYASAGLVRVADLGEWWEAETGCAIPLGAILARRDLDPARARAIDETIRESLRFARTNEAAIAPYVREHAFEMDEAVMRAHIDLYVNDFSLDLGDEGVAAIARLFEFAAEAGLVPADVRPDFV
jgi:1,4-dihydroxy-6-naphthoate synthase